MKGTSKLRSRHLSADRPLQRLRGCFLGDNAAVPAAYRVKVQKCIVLLPFLMCVNLQHFVTERDTHIPFDIHSSKHTINAVSSSIQTVTLFGILLDTVNNPSVETTDSGAHMYIPECGDRS